MNDTGQAVFGSYSDAGIFVAIGLINELAIDDRTGADALAAIDALLEFDPPTHAKLRSRHVAGFESLASTLHSIVLAIDRGDLDVAAQQLNQLLDAHPANPHLAKSADGEWHLHHHPAAVELVEMYTAICAEILARLLGTGQHQRLGLCADQTCGRAYFDQSKNNSRRFCSLSCQNRAKTTAFRNRQRAASATSTTERRTRPTS